MQINNTVNTNSRFFMMPNEVYQLGLSTGAIATYGYLMSHENRKRGDRDRYTCHPSYKTIGSAIGRSARSVAKYVAELVEAGLVSTEPTKVTTKDGQRWNGNLKYMAQRHDPTPARRVRKRRAVAAVLHARAHGNRRAQ